MHLNQFYFGNLKTKRFQLQKHMGNKSKLIRFRNNLNAGITNLEIISDLQNPSERSGKISRTNKPITFCVNL